MNSLLSKYGLRHCPECLKAEIKRIEAKKEELKKKIHALEVRKLKLERELREV